MQLARPAIALPPGRFGRGPLRLVERAEQRRGGWSLGSDVRLFATTFVAGFVVVSVLIA